jgi:mannose-1-phosphate guanylyltransferase/phosphomannomutase
VGGEKIFLVNDRGELLRNTTAAAAMVELTLRAMPGATIAVPVRMPNVFEQIAARHNGQVIRTKVDAHALTKTACEAAVAMATDGSGSFIFPQFQCASDGLMAIAKLLEFLATQHTTLSEVVRSLPTFEVAQERAPCPWENKGTVMRRLIEYAQHNPVETVDGVKIRLNEAEWVLVLPDPDSPQFQIFAESTSRAQASALAQKYADLVKQLQE